MTDKAISRRDALALLGVSGAALLTGARPARAAGDVAALQCVVRPQQTEGPFFVDEKLDRSDIRSDPRTGVAREGVPLQLTFRVSGIVDARCAPLAGAQVDVWHCDARGSYSDTDRLESSEKFLRGYQRTDASGRAQFLTIYPGWYDGRTVHMHFKIRAATGSEPTREFTSQLYFDDGLSDRVYASSPYASPRRRSMRNADDFLFRDGGSRLLLDPVSVEPGYAATLDIGLRLT